MLKEIEGGGGVVLLDISQASLSHSAYVSIFIL